LKRESSLLLGHGLGYGSGTNTTGANGHPFDLTGSQLGPNRLQVGHETTFALVVGVAHIVSNLGSFSTDFTYFGHGILLDRSRKYGQGMHSKFQRKNDVPCSVAYQHLKNSIPYIRHKKIASPKSLTTKLI
jgi:hypothetical protein